MSNDKSGISWKTLAIVLVVAVVVGTAWWFLGTIFGAIASL